MKTETRGRKPLPADKRKPPQVALKINDYILPFVMELKGNLKNKTLTPETLQSLFDVLRGDSENPESAEVQHNLVAKFDIEHQKVLNLESSNSWLKTQLKEIKIQLEQLQNKEHDCQVLTKSGERCTRPAKLVTDWHGVAIHACLQHSKK